jgi:Undecaprenyl-phosphate glucose phosphotransferase
MAFMGRVVRMIDKTYSVTNSQSSAIRSILATLKLETPLKSTGGIQLSTALTVYAAIEFLAVACSAYLGTAIYHFATFGSWRMDARYIFAAILIATLVFLVSIAFHSFFAFGKQPRHIFLSRGIAAIALSFSIFLTFLFFTQFAEAYSRGTLIFQITAVSIALVSARAFFYSWLQNAIASNQIEARRIALIGDVSHCSKFANRLKANGINTVSVFRLPVGIQAQALMGRVRQIISELRPYRVDDVIVLANNQMMPKIFDFVSALGELPAGIHIVPVDSPNALASSQIAELGGSQTLQVYSPPLSLFDLCVKRVFDFTFAVIGLIVLSPLFLIVSIAIRIDSPGPIFFRNIRHGFNNDEIHVLKFRSMTTMENGTQFTQATENDPRVTHIGRIIRRTNIDELPQLINVLRGEMSLVGPRPHATAHNALFNDVIAPFSRRHNVKPGITGWAQVNGYRGVTDALEKMQRRVEYDLYYIDNWSLLFDLKIIMMTLFSKKAYLNAY